MSDQEKYFWETDKYQAAVSKAGGEVEFAMQELISKFNEMVKERDKIAAISEQMDALVDDLQKERDAAFHVLQRVKDFIDDEREPVTTRYNNIVKYVTEFNIETRNTPAPTIQ